jgi:hypothetical protein
MSSGGKNPDTEDDGARLAGQECHFQECARPPSSPSPGKPKGGKGDRGGKGGGKGKGGKGDRGGKGRHPRWLKIVGRHWWHGNAAEVASDAWATRKWCQRAV